VLDTVPVQHHRRRHRRLDCAEITDQLRQRLTQLGWPASMRLFVRRRKLLPFEQPTLFDTGG
jgi:hypothetical protein